MTENLGNISQGFGTSSVDVGRSPQSLSEAMIQCRIYEVNASKLREQTGSRDEPNDPSDAAFRAVSGNGSDSMGLLSPSNTGSFQVYYDLGTKTYKLNKPVVIYNKKEIALSGSYDSIPSSASGGWVIITPPSNKQGSASARFTTSEPSSGGSPEPIIIPIFDSHTNGSCTFFRQLHLGAIVAGGGEINATGNTKDSEMTTKDQINFKSASDSNIQIETKEGGTITIGAYYV